jgi:hypothetical protein
MRLLILLLALCVSGCVSTEMKSYVGKDIREVMLVNGQPISAMDMGNGVRAFQFLWGGSTTTAVTSQSNAQISSSNSQGWLSNSAISSSGSSLISNGCVISYLSEWSETRHGWVVTGYRYPNKLVC